MSKNLKLTYTANVQDMDAPNQWFAQIEGTSITGDQTSVLVERELVTSPLKVLTRLVREGLFTSVTPSMKEEVRDAVERCLNNPPTRIRKITSMTGWKSGDFILRDMTIGDPLGGIWHRDRLSGEPRDHLRQGVFRDWGKGLWPALEASSFLTFAVAAGYAGPVLDLLGRDEGVLFNLWGESTTGKTSCLLAAASVIGPMTRQTLPTLDATSRALEEDAAPHNDLTLVIDEWGRFEGSEAARQKKVKELAYKLAGGSSRRRSTAASSVPNLNWRVIVLTTSEDPIEHAGRKGGERVRYADLPVPALEDGGIFDRLAQIPEKRRRQPVEYAAMIEEVSRENYGIAIRAFLQEICRDRRGAEARARELLNEFMAENAQGCSGAAQRLAAKFGIVYAAAGLAKDLRVAPWVNGHGTACVAALYQVVRRNSSSEKEVVNEVLSKLAGVLSDQRQCPRVEKGSHVPLDDAGEPPVGIRRKLDDGRDCLLLRNDQFAALVGDGDRGTRIKQVLAECRLILEWGDGTYTKQIKVLGYPGATKPRFVAFDLAHLRATLEEAAFLPRH